MAVETGWRRTWRNRRLPYGVTRTATDRGTRRSWGGTGRGRPAWTGGAGLKKQFSEEMPTKLRPRDGGIWQRHSRGNSPRVRPQGQGLLETADSSVWADSEGAGRARPGDEARRSAPLPEVAIPSRPVHPFPRALCFCPDLLGRLPWNRAGLE